MKNAILLFLLSLLGLSGCNDNMLVEYGSPSASFTLKGRVTDSAGKPIEGIRVTPVAAWIRQVPTDYFIPDEEYIREEFYKPKAFHTTPTGEYEIQNNAPFYASFNIELRLEDTDGESNGGLFVTREADVSFTSADKAGSSGNWNTLYAKQAQDILLEKQK